jgi:hypothetical protein
MIRQTPKNLHRDLDHVGEVVYYETIVIPFRFTKMMVILESSTTHEYALKSMYGYL